MLIYWLLFLVPAAAAVTASKRLELKRDGLSANWLAIVVLLGLLIGLRHEVGGDWASYERLFTSVIGLDFIEVIKSEDPGYRLLNWGISQLDLSIYQVNLVCGTLFSVGLAAFCHQQPRPWLALTVAIPYMVIVVAMGYTRQGVAVGLAMWGLSGLAHKRNIQFVMCVALAATFHKSAVVLIPLAVLSTPRGKWWTAVWVGVTGYILYVLLLADSVDRLVVNYIDAEYQSEGAAIRVGMNALPAVILLVMRKRMKWADAERNLWISMAILSLAAVAWLMMSESSTAVDRLALYMIPIQLYVFSRLPDLMSRGRSVKFWCFAVVIYYGVVQFVWLNFATHSNYWLPYRSWLFL